MPALLPSCLDYVKATLCRARVPKEWKLHTAFRGARCRLQGCVESCTFQQWELGAAAPGGVFQVPWLQAPMACMIALSRTFVARILGESHPYGNQGARDENDSGFWLLSPLLTWLLLTSSSPLPLPVILLSFLLASAAATTRSNTGAYRGSVWKI